ncbi:hypothetical protein [Mucilaginibacter sp.]|uniref:hypothetical protein n=1 Tax=Mucilaginibacter sp. TaxID=1882438 RepID=UPI002632A407|nr:hypothetical protein [Mucilaginibacter sp.]MDB4921387.1 hypothetical protein [Mucilaginibacter sp.]
MDDQLDNDLKNRIREVFDDFEDPSADEGWLLLREKFPEEQSKRRAFAWLWWGSAAAILLVFLGVGLWIKNAKEQPKNTVVKILKYPKRENLVVKKIQKNTIHNTAPATEKGPGKTQSAHNYQAGLLRPAALPGNLTSQTPVKSNQNLPLIDSPGKSTYIAKKSVDSLKTSISKTTLPQLAVNNEPKSDKPKSLVMQEKKPEKSIMAMFNEDKGSKTPKTEDVEQSKKVRFAVYAATYFNYSKGSDNQVNMGAGFTSDIKISNNLKLVTGVSIAQNSLSYSGFPSATALVKSNLYTPAANAQAGTFAATSSPTIKNYNASLVGLDIPINIKYEFNPKKSDAYVSMGLSSGTFIDESYTYKYNYPSFLSEKLQQPQDQTTGKNFGSFYFAKTLNVAVGIGYPFGKNRLVIEPFLKYPLDGLGSQNLRFGAGGLNLKLNFQSSHK